MSSSESSRGIPSHAVLFYKAIFDEQSAKWRQLSPDKQQEQSVEALALRHLAGYQELVREQLKTIPLTDQDQIPSIAKRLQAATSFMSLEASGLPTGCKEAFERLTELERDADQYVPLEQVEVFRQFVEGEIAQYGKELLDPALGSHLLKESSEVIGRRRAMAEQTPEDLERQRKELEQHREAQRKTPQTLGLTQEQFDARLATELGGASEADPRSTDRRDIQRALRLLEGPVGEDLRQRWAQYPLEGLQVQDVQQLGLGGHPLDRYWSMAREGATPALIRRQAPQGVEDVPINILFGVAALATARGHYVDEIQVSDWALTSVIGALEAGLGIPGLPDSPEELSDQLRDELFRIARARMEALLERLEAAGVRQPSLFARLREYPEWLGDADLEALCGRGSTDTLRRRYESLLDAGYTMAELRVSVPRESRGADFETLIRMGEVAQARGQRPGQIDGTNWALALARRIFPHPDSLTLLRSDGQKVELAMLVRKDVEAELQRLADEAERQRPRDQDRVRVLRAILAEYPPIDGMCAADIRYLNEMSIQQAAKVLARYESLRGDGYTLDVLRRSFPSDAWDTPEVNDFGVTTIPGMPSINDLVVVGEAARDQKIPPAQIDAPTWSSVWSQLDPSTTYGLRIDGLYFTRPWSL